MFLKIFFNYLFGYLNITIEGFFVERFINTCANKKIFLWNLNKINSSLLNANISIINFRKIRKIARKTKCRVKINYKKGIPFILNRYRKRKLLLILTIPIVLLVLLSSMYIWNIELIGIEGINSNEILEQLKSNGIEVGKMKRKINTKDVIANIRLERDDISWMEIDLKGTNAIVNIVQADKKPNIINENEYCDIVSNRRGVITKITAERGTIIAKIGDVVEEGTKLIAGVMEGKYTGTRYVHAKGEIQAKVWYSKKKKSNLTREIVKETGANENRYSIKFNNFKINLYKSIPNFEICDKIIDNKKLRLFSNFYIPINIEKTIYKEKYKEKITYGKVEMQNLLISELEQEFEKEGIDKDRIINKIINVYQTNDDSIEIELTYEVLEKIGTEEKINF